MTTPSGKLENCEVCAKNKAVYTCPKCEVRTCCLTCVNIHKKELECDGIRDRIKFIPLNKFTDLDLLSDYRLLEDVGRTVEQLQKKDLKKLTNSSNLPVHLLKLKKAASKRHVNLQYMPQQFTRHKTNTTFLNWKTDELFWRIEWIFTQSENIKWITERALETVRLASLLENILDPFDPKDVASDDIDNRKLLSEKLKFYRSAGLSGLRVFLKAEKVEKSDSRFYELDVTQSLRNNLAHKTIIEFPIIYVALKDHGDMFETIDSDTENEVDEHVAKPSVSGTSSVKKDNVNFFFTEDASDGETEVMNQG